MLISFEKNKNKLKGMNICLIDVNNEQTSVHITRWYGENAKNVSLINIFMLFGCPMAYKTKVNREWSCTSNYPQSRSG